MMETAADAWTVAQKELRELLATRGSSRLHVLLAIGAIVLLGIVLPLWIGPDWLESGWLLSLWAWTPVFIVASVAADSVAGERERHTLETLLASPLPERAILLGKVGAAVIFGWGLMFVTIIISIVAINLVFARDQLLLYKPMLLAGGALLSLLAAVVAASFGVLVSLRAASVRRAQQAIFGVLAAIFALQMVVAPLLLGVLPEAWRNPLDGRFHALDSLANVVGMAFVLVLANLLLLHTAIIWFRRCRLHTT